MGESQQRGTTRRWWPLTAALVVSLSGCADVPCADGPCLLGGELAEAVLAVRAPADDDVWIVGSSPADDAAVGPLVARWDGTTWGSVDMAAWPGIEIWSAWVTPDEAVLVGSEGSIVELDRTTNVLRRVVHFRDDAVFFAVWGADATDLWAVGRGLDEPDADGDGFAEPGVPLLWRRQDGVWAPWEDPTYGIGAPGDLLLTVHGNSPDNAWVVGSKGLALRWDGRSLRRISPEPEGAEAAAVLTIDASGPWPVASGGQGGQLLMEWDGGRWTAEAPDEAASYHALCVAPDGRAVAVGSRGARATRGDSGWVSDYDLGLAAVSSQDHHGCAWSPSGELWAVGGQIAARPLGAGFISWSGDVPIGDRALGLDQL